MAPGRQAPISKFSKSQDFVFKFAHFEVWKYKIKMERCFDASLLPIMHIWYAQFFNF